MNERDKLIEEFRQLFYDFGFSNRTATHEGQVLELVEREYAEKLYNWVIADRKRIVEPLIKYCEISLVGSSIVKENDKMLLAINETLNRSTGY